jgi:hypothetical protein
LALRIESGRLRRSCPSMASTSKAQSCTSSLCLPECSALKSDHRRRGSRLRRRSQTDGCGFSRRPHRSRGSGSSSHSHRG